MWRASAPSGSSFSTARGLGHRPGRPRRHRARAAPVGMAKGPASMVDRWRRSSRSRSPSIARNLSASLVSGARCWGTSCRRPRRGLLRGAMSIARCRRRIRAAWVRGANDPSGAGPPLFQRVPEAKVVRPAASGRAGRHGWRDQAPDPHSGRLRTTVALGAVRVRSVRRRRQRVVPGNAGYRGQRVSVLHRVAANVAPSPACGTGAIPPLRGSPSPARQRSIRSQGLRNPVRLTAARAPCRFPGAGHSMV